MRIEADEQWPIDSLTLTVQTNRLAYRQHVRFIEGTVKR